MPKINIQRLKTIIREELENFDPDAGVSSELDQAAADAESVSKMTKAVSSLLNAIASFEKVENETLKSAVESDLEQLKKTLVNITKNPTNYIDSVKASSTAAVDSEIMPPETSEQSIGAGEPSTKKIKPEVRIKK